MVTKELPEILEHKVMLANQELLEILDHLVALELQACRVHLEQLELQDQKVK